MKEFYKNQKEEKHLARTIKYKYDRFKIGLGVCVVFLFIAALGCRYIINGAGSNLFEQGVFMALLVMFGFNIIPFIGAMIAYCTAISGGRDILLCRKDEKVIFLDDSMKITYMPAFRKVEDFEYVEKTIPYNKIKSIYYNTKFKRLEIKTDYTYKGWRWVRFGEQSSNIVISNHELADIKIYNCFDNMQELMNSLEKATGIKIQNLNKEK